MLFDLDWISSVLDTNLIQSNRFLENKNQSNPHKKKKKKKKRIKDY